MARHYSPPRLISAPLSSLVHKHLNFLRYSPIRYLFLFVLIFIPACSSFGLLTLPVPNWHKPTFRYTPLERSELHFSVYQAHDRRYFRKHLNSLPFIQRQAPLGV